MNAETPSRWKVTSGLRCSPAVHKGDGNESSPGRGQTNKTVPERHTAENTSTKTKLERKPQVLTVKQKLTRQGTSAKNSQT